ncbi:LOW QUALITY PROTEIN: tRNA-uridine aminocarboxypropyltransferase 2 [Rhodamnia argentea]|uniref:tRNA-uridine aminocarboxypropyltransferase n=1 Tax=Rhodamnia argentea TaxID=178133 RepID=A0A8B8ND31_9MYRT|nr:LOW QUALITY PROTEIN: tRNA-uridine aminocarboxypropyltransferase 2 [Rhodamnia argentea]
MDPQEAEAAIRLPSDAAPPQPRRVCPGCDRPARVCLCHVIPRPPIPTATRVVVLHHPHESRHKLSTVPVLSRCLLNSTVLLHRKLRPGLSPLLDRFPPSIYLFPPSSSSSSSPSLTLSQLRASDLLRRAEHEGLVVIAFDATWKHAREMVSASEEYLSRFAVRVCLDFDYDESVDGGSIYDSELLLRKEPYGGCVSTMEAVARVLRVVETNGEEVEGRLIGVLKEMVRLQASFLKPAKPRNKLLKKGSRGQQQKKMEQEQSEQLQM